MSPASLDAWSSPKPAGARAGLAIGTMNFGKRTDEATSQRIIALAEERGITFLDTANGYNDGESERVVGRAIRGRREKFVVASKVGYGRVNGKVEGLSRAAILAGCDGSLSRLGTDYLDIYYLHAPDPQTPIEESMAAMGELLDKKKIRTWAISNYASWQILEMFDICANSSMPRPILSQLIYNLLVRQLDYEYTRFAAKYRLHTTIYNPLAGGLLTGRYEPGTGVHKGSRFDDNTVYQRRYWSERLLEVVADYKSMAKNGDLVALAYAWTASRPGVDSILVGPASVEHLDAAVQGIQGEVPPEVLRKIDEAHRAYLGTDATYAR
jgi:aryl-alcohol dehydrogenase-like predicted oxidoreductase